MNAAKLKKQIKRDIIHRFRCIEEDEELFLSLSWFLDDYSSSLDADSKKILGKAMNELVTKGLMTFSPKPHPGFQLTNKGFDLLF